jgi:hypothetical protein
MGKKNTDSLMIWIEKNSPTDELRMHRNFDIICQLEQWKRADEDSPVSGHGSGRSASELFVNYVNNLIAIHSVSSIVDVGSGDWSYMKDVNIASYNGYDVSSFIVDKTTALYGNNTTDKDDGKFVAFHVSGINQIYESADMMICKDVLQHLPLDAAQHIVDQHSKFKISILVNDATMDIPNDDILMAGGYRSLDVEKPPFNIKCNQVLNLHPTLKGFGGLKRTCVVFNEMKKLRSEEVLV